MLHPLENKLKQIQKLNQRDLFRLLFLDEDFTDLIISLNTNTQLYRQGVDSTGKSLDDIGGRYTSTGTGYSPYTTKIKEEKGQPYDHVTLKDTGIFYASFKCVWLAENDGTIQIKANTIKDHTDLLKEWGKDILGLTPESLNTLIIFAHTKIKSIIQHSLAA